VSLQEQKYFSGEVLTENESLPRSYFDAMAKFWHPWLNSNQNANMKPSQ